MHKSNNNYILIFSQHRKETENLRTADTSLKDRVRQLEEKAEMMDKLIESLKGQLEENEWTVCQKNGEIALLKTQLKETKVCKGGNGKMYIFQ